MIATLADAILQEDLAAVRQLAYRDVLNEIDEYGFTPLIEAAVMDNLAISEILLSRGADANQQDVTGGTALQWAVENNNHELCQLLLTHKANPNAYNFSGQPILVMPMLRQQTALRQLLIAAGADQEFAQDYINTKLLGHLFELVGLVNIVSPKNEFVEVDFEGFYLEVTLGLIAESLSQFRNHFAARQLRRFAGLAEFIVEIIRRASQLIKYQQYRVDIKKHETTITNLLRQEPVLIPVGYEGHAITFIKRGDIWIKCDRREDSRLYDHVVFYKMHNRQNASIDFLKSLIYEKQSDTFINVELERLLGLEVITELRVEAQISGNCSWANVEASIPALFFLTLMQSTQDTHAVSFHKTLALNYFHRWRDWNKDRALNYCIQTYQEADSIRKACKAEILAAILFQSANYTNATEKARVETLLSILLGSPYEYILQNYVRVYYFEGYTEEGKHFADLLKEHGYKI